MPLSTRNYLNRQTSPPPPVGVARSDSKKASSDVHPSKACFTGDLPAGYGERLGPDFDAKVHLALERPTRIVTLDALGNDEETIRKMPTTFAQTNVFRVMSDEGMAVLDKEIRRLSPHAMRTARTPRVLRGTTFRSKFIKGLCHSKALADFVSDLAGCQLIPHPMEIQNGHTNLAPRDAADRKKPIDTWHYDTTPFVLVLYCTCPDNYEGGEFEYFFGTTQEAEAILKDNSKRRKTEDGTFATNELPADRCRTVGRQSQGHAIFQQGHAVMHRARRLLAGEERTSLVQSFVPAAVVNQFGGIKEACYHLKFCHYPTDPLHVAMPDWVKFRTWKSCRLVEDWLQDREDAQKDDKLVTFAKQARSSLMACVEQLPYTDDREVLCSHMMNAVAELRDALSTATKEDDTSAKVVLLSDAVACIDSAAEDVKTMEQKGNNVFY